VPDTPKPSPSPSVSPATATPTAQAATPTAQAATATPTTAAPTPTSTPTQPPAPVEGTLIEHGDRGSGKVALTFDMGGRVDPALDIMQFLIDNNVRSTIFMTGAMAENQNTEAGRDVLRILDANRDQFDLGNHSYTHPDFRQLSPEQMRDELSRTADAIAPYTSLDPRPLFRPPLGAWDDDVVSVVADAGYPYVIMWDIDTIDWRPESEGGPTASDISSKVLSRAQGGSIVLMHLGGFNTLDALPAIVSGLRDAGFELVTVRELLGLAQ
jgi:peptidoglycan/xylan/chitin deacetylase (PgdA/CDA1 family)